MSIFDSNDTCECNAFSNPQNKDHVTILVDDSERTFPVVSSNVIFKPTTSEPKTIGLNGFGKRIGLSISKCRSENLFVVSANGRVYSASHYVNYLRPGGIAERVGFALGDLVLQVNRECVKGDLKLDELLDRNLEIKVISVARDKKSDHEIGCLSKNDPFLRRSEKEQMIRIEKVATDISFGFSLQRSSEKFGRRGQFRASLRVAQVLKGGPAERAGLKAGDLVEEVDGVNANSCGFEEMVQTIKSANESVHLLVIRPAISFGSTLSRLLTRLAIAKRHKDCNEDCSKDSCFLVHHHYEKISELEPDDRPVTEKRWNCSYERCKCSFTNIKELIRHYQAHSDEKPFECQICNRPSSWLFGKSSCWNARVTDSKKRASPGASPSDSSPQRSQKPKWFISTDRKRYTCSFDGCKCSFVKSDELTKHYRVHTGDKPFECEVCHQEFARSDHLALHQKRHQNRDVSSVSSK